MKTFKKSAPNSHRNVKQQFTTLLKYHKLVTLCFMYSCHVLLKCRSIQFQLNNVIQSKRGEPQANVNSCLILEIMCP